MTLSGLTGSISFICSLACVSLIDVPDALSIIFACPLVTIFLSAVMLRDKLNPVNMCAGLQLFAGVILVCKPPFIFDTLNALQFYIDPVATDETYAVGVVLAITACVTSGIMDVLVAKCEDVSTAVLVLWTAIIGLVIAVFYGLLHPGSNILSVDVVNIPARDWAIFVGERNPRFLLRCDSNSDSVLSLMCPDDNITLRPGSLRPPGLHDPHQVPAADLPQPGGQPQVPRVGPRLPGPGSHHGAASTDPLLARGGTHSDR